MLSLTHRRQFAKRDVHFNFNLIYLFHQDKAVTIISLGIGSRVDQHELLEIASDEQHVFVADDFEHIVDRLNTISMLSCNACK